MAAPETEEQHAENQASLEDLNQVYPEEFPDHFISKQIYVAGKNLLMWENPVFTALSFILVQTLLWLSTHVTLVTLVAYVLLTLMIAGAVLRVVRPSPPPGHPLHSLIHGDATVSDGELTTLARYGNDKLKVISGEIRALLLWKRPVSSLKLLLGLIAAWLVGGLLDMHVIVAGLWMAGPCVRGYRSVRNPRTVDEPADIAAPVEEDPTETSDHSENSTLEAVIPPPDIPAPPRRQSAPSPHHVLTDRRPPAPHHAVKATRDYHVGGARLAEPPRQRK